MLLVISTAKSNMVHGTVRHAPGSEACSAAIAASLGMRNVLGVGAIMKPMKSMASSVATSDVQLLSGRRDVDSGTPARNSESGVHTWHAQNHHRNDQNGG